MLHNIILILLIINSIIFKRMLVCMFHIKKPIEIVIYTRTTEWAIKKKWIEITF